MLLGEVLGYHQRVLVRGVGAIQCSQPLRKRLGKLIFDIFSTRCRCIGIEVLEQAALIFGKHINVAVFKFGGVHLTLSDLEFALHGVTLGFKCLSVDFGNDRIGVVLLGSDDDRACVLAVTAGERIFLPSTCGEREGQYTCARGCSCQRFHCCSSLRSWLGTVRVGGREGSGGYRSR